MNEVPAGWYPDPYGVPGLLRWWDGYQWAAETAPDPTQRSAAEEAATLHPEPPTAEFGGGAEGGGWPDHAAPSTSWNPPENAPEIGWEPQIEPPPWDANHPPPMADWDAPGGGEPSGGTDQAAVEPPEEYPPGPPPTPTGVYQQAPPTYHLGPPPEQTWRPEQTWQRPEDAADPSATARPEQAVAPPYDPPQPEEPPTHLPWSAPTGSVESPAPDEQDTQHPAPPTFHLDQEPQPDQHAAQPGYQWPAQETPAETWQEPAAYEPPQPPTVHADQPDHQWPAQETPAETWQEPAAYEPPQPPTVHADQDVPGADAPYAPAPPTVHLDESGPAYQDPVIAIGQEPPAPAPPTFHLGQEQPVEYDGGQAWEPPAQPDPAAYTGGPQQPPKKRRRGALVGGIAGGLALVLLLSVLGGWYWVNRDEPTTKPTGGPSKTGKSPTDEPSKSPPPTGPRVTAGAISYTQLADDWSKPVGTTVSELTGDQGQTQTTQAEALDPRTDWVAQVTIGTMAKRFDYSGPDDLQGTTEAFAKSVDGNYYDPMTVERTGEQAKEITVSGHEGYEMRYKLEFSDRPDGFEAAGESVYIAVIDTGQRPAGVYITIPDNKPELDSTIDEVKAGLRVAS